MGWNTVRHAVSDGADHWLFAGVPQDASFYFVHSYYPAPADPDDAIAWTEYGFEFVAAVERGSLVATQFHPEKSGEAGLQVLRNFLEGR
jgi:imidazole glycerol-phosphate synthase subunit HisH